jgi:hypothetical protein
MDVVYSSERMVSSQRLHGISTRKTNTDVFTAVRNSAVDFSFLCVYFLKPGTMHNLYIRKGKNRNIIACSGFLFKTDYWMLMHHLHWHPSFELDELRRCFALYWLLLLAVRASQVLQKEIPSTLYTQTAPTCIMNYIFMFYISVLKII